MRTKEVLIAVLLTGLLFKSVVFVAAVPVFFLFAVYGRKDGWLASLLVMFLAGVGLVYGAIDYHKLAYLGYFLLMGIIIGEGVLRRMDFLRLASIATIVPWFVAMCIFVILQFGGGVPVIAALNSFLTGGLEQTFKMQEALTAISSMQMAYIKDHSAELIAFMLRIIPGAMLLFSMLVTAVTLLFGKFLTRRSGALTYFGNTVEKRFPFWPVWVVISCGAGYFLDAYMVHNPYLKFAAINGLLVSAGIFFIQGCFVISFWLKKGRSPFIRLAVYGIIIAFLQMFGLIIIALGLSDQWLNLRRRVTS